MISQSIIEAILVSPNDDIEAIQVTLREYWGRGWLFCRATIALLSSDSCLVRCGPSRARSISSLSHWWKSWKVLKGPKRLKVR